MKPKKKIMKKSISNIIEDAIDTFISERNNDKNEYFIIDGNIVESLEKSKKILGEYFESFIPQYIKNLVAVYENNMKFVINHYRLLDMYIRSMEIKHYFEFFQYYCLKITLLLLIM